MTITDVQTQVEDIAQALVLLDPTDTAGVVELGEQLASLTEILREGGRETEAVAAENAAALAAGCAGGDEVPAAVIAALSQAVEAVQICLEQPDPPTEEGAEIAESDTVTERPEGLTLSQLVDEDIVAEFLSRQTDALGDVEKLILAFESDDAGESMQELKRWFHTLKGESGLLGLTDMSEVCHATEDMIQAEPPAICVDRLLGVLDWLLSCFEYLEEKGPQPASAEELAVVLRTPLEADPDTVAEADAEVVIELAEEEAPEADVESGEIVEPEPEAAPVELPQVILPDYAGKNLLEGDVSLLQDFIGESHEHLEASEAHLLEIESDSQAIEPLNAVFRGFHTIKGLAGFAELDHIQELAHKAENLLDMARKGELDLSGGSMDLVFESVDMMKRLVEGVVEALASNGHPDEVDALPSLVARLIAATEGAPVAAAPAPALDAEPSPEAAPAKSGFVPLSNMKKPAAGSSGFVPLSNMKKAAPTAPTPPAATAKPAGKSAAAVKVKEAVRVDAERLDRLIETIGEMVIAESMVSQNQELRDGMSVKLAKDLDHLDKISRELQEIGMSLRMVPVRPVFQKMARLVRDLAKKTGRKVEFAMAGEDTELDKNVVDKIGDPLVHMVRNAVDHGLEPTNEERVTAGKPEAGKVTLRAFHKGGNICIEIEDDGRGLPRDKILAKAIERGLVREGDNLSDRDINNLIFEPGFSTAKEVTDISGRGVGMDVVRRNIEELRGTCEITSTPGQGSRFSIKLPLTLAIIEGMVISCGSEHYIVPTLSVVRLVRPSMNDISMVFDRGEMLAFEDEHLPLFRLGRLFGVEASKHDVEDAVVVVVEEEGRKMGLLADDLLGQQSIVIKSLGESMQDTEGVAGGAIMSDGNVALILDVAGLVRVAHASSSIVEPVDEVADEADDAAVSEMETGLPADVDPADEPTD